MFEQNFIENQLVILTKQTLDVFFRQENAAELIALYTFYYYTAKWQQTNQPKCTTDYVAKALHWKRNKVCRVKKQLVEFGLIEDVRIVDHVTKKVQGYYIKMNYIFKKETLEKSQCIPNPPTGNEIQGASVSQTEGVAFGYTNALSTDNTNALSTNNLKKESKKERKEPEKQRKENVISFNQIIENYTSNQQLRNELKEHLKVRKNKKAALTNRAIELSLKKLDDLASNDAEKIKMVQNAIMSGWTTFYPLKKDEKKKMGSNASYDMERYEKTGRDVLGLYEYDFDENDYNACSEFKASNSKNRRKFIDMEEVISD